MTHAPSMPALEALLREVEAPTPIVQNEGSVIDCVSGRATAAPRLAAIVRVAVEALNSLDDPWGDAHPRNVASAALSRIEALAKGEGS